MVRNSSLLGVCAFRTWIKNLSTFFIARISRKNPKATKSQFPIDNRNPPKIQKMTPERNKKPKVPYPSCILFFCWLFFGNSWLLTPFLSLPFREVGVVHKTLVLYHIVLPVEAIFPLSRTAEMWAIEQLLFWEEWNHRSWVAGAGNECRACIHKQRWWGCRAMKCIPPVSLQIVFRLICFATYSANEGHGRRMLCRSILYCRRWECTWDYVTRRRSRATV